MTGHVHGQWKTGAWNSWKSMRERCLDPNNASYPQYGGRGITYDPRWDDFQAFFKDMGPRPKYHTLERLDNAQGYHKDNCKWATKQEQDRNRSTTVLLTFEGRTMSLTEWARFKGIKKETFFSRYRKYGLNTNVLFSPVQKKFRFK